MRLDITDTDWAALHAHMQNPRERAAFMFATAIGQRHLEVTETWLLDDDDHYRVSEADHLVLAEGVRPQVIAHAHANGLAAVEAHSHYWPGPSTRFSRYDLEGLTEFAPHMLWRLPDRPYTALVIGEDSFDGLWWHTRDDFGSIHELHTGPSVLYPTGLSLPHYQRVTGVS